MGQESMRRFCHVLYSPFEAKDGGDNQGTRASVKAGRWVGRCAALSAMARVWRGEGLGGGSGGGGDSEGKGGAARG